MTFLPERDQTTGQATGRWYNDEISTPITEEALREKGFEDEDHGNLILELKWNRSNGTAYLVYNSGLVCFRGMEDFCAFYECRTMKDIDDLIRLFGGKEG